MPRKTNGAKTLAELRCLGPASLRLLEKAGVTTLAELKRRGAVRAYCDVRASQSCASLNLLYALEGALSGRHWREVMRNDKLSLVLAVDEELRRKK